MTETPIICLSADEHRLRVDKVKDAMRGLDIDRALVCSNANLYYLTGRVFAGYVYLSTDAEPVYFVRRPTGFTGDRVIGIRKPEQIPGHLADMGIDNRGSLGLELARVSYNTAMRLAKAFGTDTVADVGTAINIARSTKTELEIDLIRRSAELHASVYHRIPSLYIEGMSDIELQIAIENVSRLKGCLGNFRIAGEDMELHMGNVLAGDNADTPSPYDFAMGGGGIDPSLPVGANGTVLRPGMSVMVDTNGNFTGYMDDMTRCFTIGTIADLAVHAHEVSIAICHELQALGTPGSEAKALYDRALEMAREAGLEEYFMGHRQHAGFVGHGVGIEVNEWPVLAPRSKDILQPGNVIAIEPKFVIPGTGAVGIENTYAVQPEGPMSCLTVCPEQLIEL